VRSPYATRAPAGGGGHLWRALAPDWLAAHPRWRFVFTLKHASWLNQAKLTDPDRVTPDLGGSTEIRGLTCQRDGEQAIPSRSVFGVLYFPREVFFFSFGLADVAGRVPASGACFFGFFAGI
jgi:hypothetical protein